MTSLRLVGIGFLLALAFLPAMLLNLVGAASAATATENRAVQVMAAAPAGEVSRARATSLDDHPRKPWEGASSPAKPITPAKPAAQASPAAPPVVEIYLSTPDALELAGRLYAGLPADAPRPSLLCFGAATEKDAAPDDIDPFVAVDAGRRRRAYARAMTDQRTQPGPVAILSQSDASTPIGRDLPATLTALSRASKEPAAATLELKLARGQTAGDAAPIRLEFTAKPSGHGRSGKPAATGLLGEDVVINLALVEDHESPTEFAAGAPRVGRVLTIKAFKLPKDGAGSAELLAPPTTSGTPARPRRVVAYLQHGKTLCLFASAQVELK